jgi:hypothetical protein
MYDGKSPRSSTVPGATTCGTSSMAGWSVSDSPAKVST